MGWKVDLYISYMGITTDWKLCHSIHYLLNYVNDCIHVRKTGPSMTHVRVHSEPKMHSFLFTFVTVAWGQYCASCRLLSPCIWGMSPASSQQTQLPPSRAKCPPQWLPGQLHEDICKLVSLWAWHLNKKSRAVYSWLCSSHCYYGNKPTVTRVIML